ncbi:MAG: SpoVA/SpoVAEb family sporulation membrane protein [Mycoplasmatota bacterium]|nr:SpoVA/SpoVAEb family sporulation membrane protein [Mycoplasmatota bacterium]
MKNSKYDKIADQHKALETRGRNALIAFVVGGIVGLLGEAIIEILCMCFHISRSDATTFMIMIMIFMASLCTALGFFDKLVTKFKCGLLIPITGFAHSMTSAALDYKNEGLIYGIGSNIFKLAGSVILYGVVSAWFFGMIRYFIEVI